MSTIPFTPFAHGVIEAYEEVYGKQRVVNFTRTSELKMSYGKGAGGIDIARTGIPFSKVHTSNALPTNLEYHLSSSSLVMT